MGGVTETLTAATKKRLETKARERLRLFREMGMDVRAGWDAQRATKNDDGEWEIVVSAHT